MSTPRGIAFAALLALGAAGQWCVAGGETPHSHPHVHSGVPEALGEHPAVGELAPDFSLKDTTGRSLALGEVLGRGYVVLAFGSVSSSNFKKSAPALERLAREWEKLEVRVLLVYTKEAHPAALRGKAPKSYQDRTLLASQARRDLSLTLALLVDGWDDAVHRAYGAIPDAAYLLDSKGTIVLRQNVARPPAIEQELHRLLRVPPPAP